MKGNFYEYTGDSKPMFMCSASFKAEAKNFIGSNVQTVSAHSESKSDAARKLAVKLREADCFSA